MTIFGMEAWLTCAVEDGAVSKALVLAGSLRRVSTAKKTVVFTTFSVSQKLRERLEEVFDLVLYLEQATPNGFSVEDYGKMEGFGLLPFSKCVYLSPNSLVLRNCDAMFEKYGEFAALGNEEGVNSSVFLFTPKLELKRALGKMGKYGLESKLNGGIKRADLFNKCFSLWIQNNIDKWERLDEEYNIELDLRSEISKSLTATVSIANFGDGHPLDLSSSWGKGGQPGLGRIEMHAVNKVMEIYKEDVLRDQSPSRGLETFKNEPIAIVGMSFRLPGGNSEGEFWDLLINGRDAIIPLPQHRWIRNHTKEQCENRLVEAGFLTAPVDEFDAKFFGMSGKEAEFLDPQQRLLHEVTWEAFEEAMIDPHSIRGSQTSVFVGSWIHDYKEMVAHTTDVDFFRVYMGNSIAAGAARLSRFLEISGASIATESGCSSGMVAVDMACKSLRNRDSNLALACGVNLLLHPFDQSKLSFIISPDYRCKTFDEKADGFARAEGCAVLLLKRMSDAVREGDHIWGLLRGSAVTQEGLSKSLGTPTANCESMAMELAMKDGDVKPSEVSYIEAHGTGTAVGDPMEVAAITKAYGKGGREQPLVIGSVKTNVGHTESVSGITGIIKVLLSMKNEKIPPHLNLEVLNPAINLEAIPATIPLESVDWPKKQDKPRLAGVSSFGISGSDAHAILQEPPSNPPGDIQGDTERPLHIMKISAKSPESLKELLTTYEKMLASKELENGFSDLAYSANIGRASLPHRATIIAANSKQAVEILQKGSFKQADVHSGRSKLCFLFTGQGSQYPNMGADLYATSPIFRDEFDKCDQILSKRYGINLREVLWGRSIEGPDLSRTLYSQTGIFCIEYCLLQLWESWGVKPDYVMGHSLGEFAAAVATGRLDLQDALMLVAERSRLIDALPAGKMLVIKADKERVEQTISKFTENNRHFWVDYAAINSTEQTVVAGDSQNIEAFAKYCGEEGLKSMVLASSHAFHSRHMDPMLQSYHKVAQTVKTLPILKNGPLYISGVEGKLLDTEWIDADYWVRHTREAVQFTDACKVVQAEGCSLFLEVGPHPVLSALTMLNMEGSSVTCFPSLRRREEDWSIMLDTLSRLFLSGWSGEINWKGFDRYYNRSRVPLPFYPFQRKSVWKDLEPFLPNVHPLLGKVIPTGCEQTIFEKKLTLKNTPYIQDHAIGRSVIYPGACFLEMCLAGGYTADQGTSCGGIMKPKRPLHLKSLKVSSPLALQENAICTLQTIAKLANQEEDEMGYSVEVFRHVESPEGGVGEWISHASGKFLPIGMSEFDGSPVDIQSIQSAWEPVDNEDFYKRLPEVGLHFGPKFQTLGNGWKSEGGMLVQVKPLEIKESKNYMIHPIIVDAMIQATMLWASAGKLKMKLQVPVQIGEFLWLQPPSSPESTQFIYCTSGDGGNTLCTLIDEEGTKLAHMSGVDFIETSVKLVEEMIQQQNIAMPKLWEEVWNSVPGALESAYDFTWTKDAPFLQFNGVQRKQLADINDAGEYEWKFYHNLCNLAKSYFLSAMYEMGWAPEQGTPFTTEDLVSLLPQPKEHLRRYIRFFLQALAQAGIIRQGEEEGDGTYYFPLTPPTKLEIDEALKVVITPDDRMREEYRMVSRTGSNLSKVMRGEVNPLQLLFPEDPSQSNADKFYTSMAGWIEILFVPVNEELAQSTIDVAYDSFKTSHKNNPPVLRLLEIGAGTGNFTALALDFIEKSGKGKPFEYTFTDVSASFFNAAEKKFEKHGKSMVFKRFNMEEDALAQGFCPEYYDIIYAGEVLHVSKNITKTMANVNSLLKPGGMYQILETMSQDLRITQVFGILEGYWQFEDLKLRPYHATMTPDKWTQVLKGIGCDEVTCIPAYHGVHGILVARKSAEGGCNPPLPLEQPSHSWIIFEHESSEGVAAKLKSKLVGVNRKVQSVRRPSECTEAGIKSLLESQFVDAATGVDYIEGVVYLWGLEDSILLRDQRQISLPLVSLVQEMTKCKIPPRLYVVTQGVENVEGFEVSNPTSATLHGIVKSLTNENSALYLTCLDLSAEESSVDQVDRIFTDLWLTGKRSRIVAFKETGRLCPKLRSAKVGNNQPLTLPRGSDRYQLILPQTRTISDLEFGVLERYSLEENEVEVAVKAMALNFRDVFTVIKPIQEFVDFNTVGLDFSGVITKLGSGVKGRKVGDRVMGMNMNVNLSLPSHIKLEEEFAVPLPDSMTFAEGSTLPVVFSTVVQCLIIYAKMKKGERILIHTASGGVGLCAIQVAQRMGVEVIATAGSKKKRSFLRNLGLNHVFHSRTTDFAVKVLEVTEGKGVDIVLNSLTGEGFKEASLSALAKNGRFIEMSALNVWEEEEVKALRPDVYYKLLVLRTLSRSQRLELIEQLKEFLLGGLINPIPYERFDAVNIRGALNYLQKAKHIGKIVCVMPEVKVENSKISVSSPLFNELSTYLVTGGLGGIGLEVVKWMLGSGAKHIAIASRSRPKPEIGSQIEAWNRAGAHVEAFAIDIGDHEQCQGLFEELKSVGRGFPQLRGVMHAAGVLSDAILENQNWSSFLHCYNPKVNGTWNLHDLTKGLLLEHFVVYSSMAVSLGSPGQSNHAASNNFEDSLAAYRKSIGLPATSVQWGNWGEVGVAAEIDFPGIRPITTSQGLLALETFLRTQTSHLSVVNLDSFALAARVFPNLKHYVDDKRLFGELKATVTISSDKFWKDVDSAEGQEGKLLVFKNFIKSTLKNILKMDQDEGIDDLTEFQSLGVDSLMMLEMKNGLSNVLAPRMTITASHLKDCNNTEAVANRLLDILEGDQTTQVAELSMEELHKLIREDSILPEHIRPMEGMSIGDPSSIEKVLLTGVTGVLGPYILRELSQRPSIKKIYCLIRKLGSVPPSERLLQRLRLINLDVEVDMSKVECIQGDMTDEQFGLSDYDYGRLSLEVDAVISNAVRADHTAKYSRAPTSNKQDVRTVNVNGTVRLLEFAVHSKLKHVYHSSTLLTVPSVDEEGCLSEEWQDVGAFDELTMNVGYPLSKHICEMLCKEGVARGIPCKVFRHPVIAGDSRTGRCDYVTNHVILRWLAYMKLGCMPDMPAPMIAIPVDECARLSLSIFFNSEALPDVYNVMHRDGGVEQVLIGIGAEHGIDIQPVSFAEFVEKLKSEKEDSPLAQFKQTYMNEASNVKDNFEGGNLSFSALRMFVLDCTKFYGSRKLARLIPGYESLESTDSVMRRDLGFLKESGVFHKFGIK